MKRAVMYGAGNIGRGFIGQLFSESGYEVVFIDVNKDIICRLNNDKKYPINILTEIDNKELIIENVRGVIGFDMEAVAEEISHADIMATAVGVNVLPRLSKPIAEGLKKRWNECNFCNLNIIVCENLLDANRYLEELIKKELTEDERQFFENHIGLVEASIGRMVPVVTPEIQKGNILRICAEVYGELPVDKDGFKGDIPYVKNMLPYSPFNFYIQRKLFIHNMGHAMTAYLGKLKGYKFIWEAIGDPRIYDIVCCAMKDSARALSIEHGVEIESLMDHVQDLLRRFGNKQLGDTVNRVGNDTKRKLSSNDRLVGALNLCIKHGINPVHICFGIAAALKFDSLADEGLLGIREMLNTNGPIDVLENLCKLTKETPWSRKIIDYYLLINEGKRIEDIIA